MEKLTQTVRPSNEELEKQANEILENKKRGQYYEQGEDDFIKQYCNLLPDEEVGKLLHRSSFAIVYRRLALGYKKERRKEIKKICLGCGKEFMVPNYRKDAKYCSNKCVALGSSKRAREKRNCVICGKEFETKKYRRKRTCSKRCANKLRSITHINLHLTGRNSPIFKTGIMKGKDGYVRLRINCLKSKEDMELAKKMKPTSWYILEHRLVMAKHLGRPLQRYEIIHHINGDKSDNRIENLKLLSICQHLLEHSFSFLIHGKKIKGVFVLNDTKDTIEMYMKRKK